MEYTKLTLAMRGLEVFFCRGETTTRNEGKQLHKKCLREGCDRFAHPKWLRCDKWQVLGLHLGVKSN